MSATTTAPDTTDPTIRPRLIATTTITRTTGTVAHPPRIATIRVGLDDGRAAALRPSSVQDLEAITDLYEALGPESRRLRFLQAMPEVPIRTMRSLVEIDQRDHLAWVAFDGTRCVGEARVVRLRRDRRAGEVAFAVHPDWRRIGLARRLVRTVGSAARSLGVHTMTASVSSAAA